ncbi:NUDIX hydrolase [Staphylococcus epidermidis]
MCKRITPPFKYMYNLIGGKVEKDENVAVSAYREMMEETTLTSLDVNGSCILLFWTTHICLCRCVK